MALQRPTSMPPERLRRRASVDFSALQEMADLRQWMDAMRLEAIPQGFPKKPCGQ